MAMRDETLYMKLVDLKCRYVQKQPASLSILEKHDRVKALNEFKYYRLIHHFKTFERIDYFFLIIDVFAITVFIPTFFHRHAVLELILVKHRKTNVNAQCEHHRRKCNY